jgi:hypothetical protein
MAATISWVPPIGTGRARQCEGAVSTRQCERAGGVAVRTVALPKTSAYKPIKSSKEGSKPMAVKLNQAGFDHAKKLVNNGCAVADNKDAWSKHQPSAEDENEFIRDHGFSEFANWHLGIDAEQNEETKARYKFPYGDFKDVHRCAVLSAESRAGQYKHFDIENAAAHLHEMIDSLLTVHAKR